MYHHHLHYQQFVHAIPLWFGICWLLVILAIIIGGHFLNRWTARDEQRLRDERERGEA